MGVDTDKLLQAGDIVDFKDLPWEVINFDPFNRVIIMRCVEQKPQEEKIHGS